MLTKMSEKRPIFGSQFLVQEMQDYLGAEMSMIRGILETKKLKGRSLEIAAMIASLLGTGNAILILSKENHRFYKECVMLARGFFEHITNVCYLLECGEDTFEECMQHTIYRQYLRRSRNKKVIKDAEGKELMKISLVQKNIENLRKNDKIDELIDKSEKNKKTRFPIPKIEMRLGFLAKQNMELNISLFLAYQQAYYDDASEALHGSFYGVLFHVLNLDSREKNNAEIDTNKNTALLLWQTGELFHQLIVLLNQKNSIKDFYEKSILNSKATLEKIKFALNSKEKI
jgi:hypothetical protein